MMECAALAVFFDVRTRFRARVNRVASRKRYASDGHGRADLFRACRVSLIFLPFALLGVSPLSSSQSPRIPPVDIRPLFPPDDTPESATFPVSALQPALAFPAQAVPSVAGVSPLGWIEQGPAPIIGAQVETIGSDNAAVGAVQVVLPHPTNAQVLYIGAVNGGVWVTSSALFDSPIWFPLTDRSRSRPFCEVSNR